MAEDIKGEIPGAQYDLNAKWDACITALIWAFVAVFALHSLVLLPGFFSFGNIRGNIKDCLLDYIAECLETKGGGTTSFNCSPVTRSVSVAFGAGVGVGSAYSECSQKLYKSPVKFTPGISDTSPAKAGEE